MKVKMGLAVLCLAGVAAWGQTAEELIQKNLAARGGAEKLRAIQSLVITGRIEFGGTSSPITVQIRRPNQIREDFQIEGTELTRAFDGVRGWQRQQKGQETKVETLSDGANDGIQQEAENAIEGPLLDYAKKGSTAEFLGRDTMDGKAVYKLRIWTHLGTAITQFLDASTYLEIHEEIDRVVNGQHRTIVETVGDYREVGGVKFAHLFVSGPPDNPSAARLQVEKMEPNAPVETKVFAMPKV